MKKNLDGIRNIPIFATLYLSTRPTSALGAFLIGFSAQKGAYVTLSDRATEAEKPIFHLYKLQNF